MAYRINPTPSAEPYYNFKDKDKNKKQANSGVKTVTPPPQPVHEVSNTTNTTPTAKNGYTQDVPKPKKLSTAQISSAKQNTARQSTTNSNLLIVSGRHAS